MMPMTVAEIAEAVHGSIAGADGRGAADEAVATSVFSDSRQLTRGSVFVAIAGERVDGHDFVAGAAAKGAVAALVEHEVAGADGIAQIVVSDTVKALGLLARHNIDKRRALGSDFSIIGITGSVGKTTTKDLLNSLLSKLAPTVAPVGSFNNDIGLPLTALKVGAGTRFFIAEMGANHVGEIAGLTRIAPPDLAVVLKVGVAHLGEFGSVERIAQAKSEIVRGLVPNGVAVLNAGDQRVAAMQSLASGKVLWFGLGDDNAGNDNKVDGSGMVRCADVKVDDLDHPEFTLVLPDGARSDVTLGISGAHNVINALAASTVAHYFGMSAEAIAEGLADVRRISPHRMAISTVDHDGATFTLIDDSFNANPDSTRAGLDGLAAWHSEENDEANANAGADADEKEERPYRIAVLGVMLELGDDEQRLHAQIGQYAAGLGLDEIVAVGSEGGRHFDALAQALAQGAEQANKQDDTHVVVRWVHNVDEADREVCRSAREHRQTVVLLKGSHVSGLSSLADRWADTQKNKK
ncbi:UDP-N-acetylmuramoyl-tripeptide--D-alanyl-D-alanine ligase [Bifidobacterium sp. ESL0790]|uniref:UDP-N-acetylmuramoyl-tripeptide--D-alanyl-D- alanine ligase n=1 Tax=Bifidobacterium sp. ESL0790 TaxID=2983233 RepID=UPI0023F80382|nr:UDP-N-acetylmuramoyl-tripeptide--D-alanyl-D-alanine ligase [Bifidobacterium sp. ESL0790]WEV72858.1 UDP-N-acetylmuramoyl-tripeptide--D-alanyl-D-alanine ligase [Bifidobacterium sp. ESL0790]